MNSPRTIWITGAGGGLGQAMVQHFLQMGDRVVAAYHSHNPFTSSETLWPLSLDVTDSTQVNSVCSEIVGRWGSVDVLINNAGCTSDELLARMTEEAWDRVLDTHLKGAFLCSRAIAPSMIHRRSGSIIQISSFAALHGHAGQSNYVAAKAGLIGLTQSLAREMAEYNVQVHAILPGVLRTGMTSGLSESQLNTLREANLLRRLNDCEEVARFIYFLTTLSNVSGQVFQLDSRLHPWT